MLVELSLTCKMTSQSSRNAVPPPHAAAFRPPHSLDMGLGRARCLLRCLGSIAAAHFRTDATKLLPSRWRNGRCRVDDLGAVAARTHILMPSRPCPAINSGAEQRAF